jgi:uncharacterized protein (TIGR04255 family)
VFSNGPAGVRLESADHRRLVRIAPFVISVHALPPYPQWPAFSSDVRAVVEALEQVSKQDIDVERVGVRYINRVNIPSGDDISNYFVVQPLHFPDVEMSLQNFVGRTEHHFGSNPTRKLVSTFASTDSGSESASIVLDLDVIAEELQGIDSAEDAMSIANELRELERQVFEASITDGAREAFGGYKEVELS